MTLAHRMTGQRVLVAGGTGFIGRRLVDLLNRDGANVTLLHRGRSEPPEGASEIVVTEWNPTRLREAIAGHSFDHVYNLAAYGVTPSDRDPVLMREINIAAALALFDAACRCGARTFVHTGSSSEYAPIGGCTPLREDAALETMKAYGASKAEATVALLERGQSTSTRVAIARVFGVYGPGEASHRLSTMLWSKLSQGERVPLSTGTQIRDFLHVDDVAAGLIALALRAEVLQNPVVVNLCSGQATTVAQFARGFAAAMSADAALLGFGDLPLRPDDLAYVVGDPSRLFSLTGWRGHFTLTDGLKATIEVLQNSR